MSERTGTCSYVLDPYDPSTWGGEEGDWCYVEEPLNENGRWHCPHDVASARNESEDTGTADLPGEDEAVVQDMGEVEREDAGEVEREDAGEVEREDAGEVEREDGDLCIFHLPPNEKDDEAVMDALIDAIECERDEGEADDGGADKLERDEREAYDGGTDEHEGRDGEADSSGVDDSDTNDSDTNDSDTDNSDTDEGEADRRARSCQQFIGARFGSFVVRDRTLETDVDVPLDFRHARFDGIVEGEGTTFASHLRLDGATVHGGISLRGAQLDGGFSCRGATVAHGADLSGATIGDDLDGREATFVDGLFVRAAKVRGEATFGDVTVEGPTHLESATIEGGADVTDARLEGAFDGRGATIDGALSCRGLIVAGDIDLRELTLSTGGQFHGVDLDAARLSEATLPGSDFGEADLTDADLREADLRGANLERAIVSRSALSGADLRGAAIHGAVLGDATIDEETSFGDRCPYDPAFEPESGTGVESGRPTESADALDADALDGDALDGDGGRLRAAAGAYRLVEQLARANALPALARHSFVRRRDVHRRRHYETGAYGRWLGTWLSRLVVLYGESWRRLVATGTAVAVGFALLYPAGGWIDPADGPPLTYGPIATDPLAFGTSLYFSAVTFASLGVGDVHPVGIGRLLAALEALAGAAVLALLVFVLARRGMG